MGRSLRETSPVAAAAFAAADDALQEPLSKVIFEGPVEDLKRTKNTQPAILTVSVAAYRALLAAGVPAPAYVAGHSLGEYSALVAAGGICLSDAVRAARSRGELMQAAVPEGQGAMAAVLGMDAAKIDEVVRGVSNAAEQRYVAVANFNGPEQTVIAGHTAGIEAATVALKAAGAKKVMPLPVSAPFHCALMEPVKAALTEVLAGVAFNAPTIPVVTNVEAKPNLEAARIPSLLIEQVTAPVRFTEIARFLLDEGVTTFVEVGPGKALIGMLKRMTRDLDDVKLLNVEDEASLKATLEALA
jgi:[acyl-carrier-protein] S-malonyltransferase